MSKNLNNIKLDNIDNIEEIDKAINKISEKITEIKLVSKIDINDIIKIYNNIDFNGFKPENREKIKRNIDTGDKIKNTFNMVKMRSLIIHLQSQRGINLLNLKLMKNLYQH